MYLLEYVLKIPKDLNLSLRLELGYYEATVCAKILGFRLHYEATVCDEFHKSTNFEVSFEISEILPLKLRTTQGKGCEGGLGGVELSISEPPMTQLETAELPLSEHQSKPLILYFWG